MEIDIKKIAKLSRLAIEPEREEKFQKDMQNIIDMVEQLPEMEAGDLSPKVEDAMALREDTLSIDDPRLRVQPRLAVVLGTEGDGLADGTIAACDYTVKIPMFHGVDSLNVAAASAVAFWELRPRENT